MHVLCRAALSVSSALSRVSCAESYTPHGLRVLGYNLSKRENGVDLTVAHGGWLSSGHTRYERFGFRDVLSIGAKMLGQPVDPRSSERPVLRGKTRRGDKDGFVDVTSLDAPESSDSEDGLPDADASVETSADPPGFTCESRTTMSGRTYKLWFAPNGSRHSSRVRAWISYHASRSSPDGAASDAHGADHASRGSPDEATSGARGAEPSRPARLGPAQCGDPACVVPAVNGRHPGLCKFPELSGKRRRQ